MQLRFLFWSICQYDNFCSLLPLQDIWLYASLEANLWFCLEGSGVTKEKWRHLSPGAAFWFWGRKLRLECHATTTKCQMSTDASVATSPVVLRWFYVSPRTGLCAKNKSICMWHEQAIIEWSRWSDLGEWPLTMLVNLVNSWLCLRTVTTRVISSGDFYCLGKNFMMPFFCKWPSPGLNKQSIEKKFFD